VVGRSRLAYHGAKAAMRDPRTLPPPPIGEALGRLGAYGLVALVNIARQSVVWFAHDGDVEPPLAELLSAARVFAGPERPLISWHDGRIFGSIRFPYVLVLELRRGDAPSREFTGLVSDVCGELQPHMPEAKSCHAPTGGPAPPSGSAAPARAAVFAHAPTQSGIQSGGQSGCQSGIQSGSQESGSSGRGAA
jgi:hypothetical protein